MKKLFLLLTLSVATVTGYAQTTNQPPVVSSPIFEFLTRGSNYVVATYGIVDATTHKLGAGIGLGYKATEFLVPTLRLDYVDNRVWVPSGNLQIQVPVKILGKYEVVPFVSTGIATTINSKKSGEAVGIFGTGLAVRFNKKPNSNWAIPAGVIGAYEHWSGGGLNSDQWRIGPYWKL